MRSIVVVFFRSAAFSSAEQVDVQPFSFLSSAFSSSVLLARHCFGFSWAFEDILLMLHL
jgi:hypothetical protein